MNIQNTEITRRSEEALNNLQDRFRDIYYVDDFRSAINSLKASEGKSAHPSKLHELFKMLDACNIPYLKGQDTGYYEDLVNTISLSDGTDVQTRMMGAILSIYDCYPTPEDYMKRIVDRLENKADGWNNDTLRLRILKQFVKYGEYLPKSGISGRKYIQDYAEAKGCKDIKNKDEVVQSLDDGIFSAMELSLEELTAVMGIEKKDNSDKKNKLKKKDIIKDKLEILKAADDLATGKFRINGATKQYLYLFAMAYGMTYCTGTDDKLLFDAERDIDKNLFKDYYTNNFLRFLTDAYKGKTREYENDPSGQGINYKNYAEMVYLYYISREDMSPKEKIKKSNAMIERIKKEMLGKGAPKGYSKKNQTKRQRALFVNEETTIVYSDDILSKSEEEFEKFICENYYCDTSGSYVPQDGRVQSIMSPLQLENDQNTAYDEYRIILDKLKRELSNQGECLDNCNYGLWFTDVAAFRKYENLKIIEDGSQDKFDNLIELLRSINDYIGNTVDEGISSLSSDQERKERSIMRTEALYIDNPEKITRFSMITAYYYYYNAVREDDGDGRIKGFESVFNEFKNEIDRHLEKSHYQLFSGKNIFDVIVAFSSYAYINGL